MSLALELAERGRLTVSPNPMVGCVLVQNESHIVGQGFHARAGEPHAEVWALREAGERARGATAYLSLEPCCHEGKTPPCTEALIKAGVQQVVIACLDPNPLVSGKGVEALRSVGIKVEVGLCGEKARRINASFFHYMTHKRPFVIAKWAMSLDGKSIVNPGDHPQISGEDVHKQTHQLRQQVDAILIGANTLRQDNPRLTVRLSDLPKADLKNPLRVVLAGEQPLPAHSQVFDPNLPGKTLIAITQHSKPVPSSISSDILMLPADLQKRVHLPSLLDALGQREVTTLLVEGGPKVHQQFFEARLVNQVQTYLSPFVIAAFNAKQPVAHLTCHSIGEDFHFIGEIHV